MITDPVVIDGTTQPGPAGAPRIVLDGTSAGGNANGLHITAGNSTVRGLAINRFGTGGAGAGGAGIVLTSGLANIIEGNYIGTDATGLLARPNRLDGIWTDSAGHRIGGTTAAQRNVISGNGRHGVVITRVTASANRVQGNYIGVNAAGTAALGNAGHGIELFSSSGNVIGSDVQPGNAAAGNVIASNLLDGVPDICWNRQSDLGERIFTNSGLGINLGLDTVTANDPGDGDTGANNAQNFPVLASVTGGATTTIDGTLNSTPGNSFRIQFFAGATCDPSLNGEGQTFIGETTTLSTDGNGDATFNAVLGVNLAVGTVITATAIDISGNTSEFSVCRASAAARSPT